MKGASSVGGSAPKPPRFIAFVQPEWTEKGAVLPPPRAIPAAETVARVASQHCPIPSGSGTISLQQMFSAGYEKPANSNLSLISVSQRQGPLHSWNWCAVPGFPASTKGRAAGELSVLSRVSGLEHPTYFPIQKVEKIRFRISSAVVAPVIASSGWSAA